MTLERKDLATTASNASLAEPSSHQLRQVFFERVLSSIKNPMELVDAFQRTFPLPSTLLEALHQLDELKKCLDSFRPLDAEQVLRLQAVWDIEYIYESNRIEGNTLTLSETSLVISEGITVAGKTIEEHLEAINHKEAVLFLHDLVGKNVELSEHIIKLLHELILKKSKNHDDRGRYRSVPVIITGTTYTPPQPWQVPKLMEELMHHYHEKRGALHPVELAADVHAELVGVHPFIDGNGRTSRLVMNLLLLQAGFPIANISGDRASRLSYYEALNKSHIQGEDEPFRMLVAKFVRESLLKYLAMVSSDMSPAMADKGAYFYERMSRA